MIAARTPVDSYPCSASGVPRNDVGGPNDSIHYAVVSVVLPQPPKAVTMNGAPLKADSFDHHDGVLRLRFPNRAEPIHVAVTR